MKKLYELVDCKFDIDIVGIADDSRSVKPGYLFVATKGFNVDHFDYIEDAISNGAVAIVADHLVNKDIPVIMVDDVNESYVTICQRFFEVNPKEFKFIGITGTDGKTTTASVVRQLFLHNMNIAYIGTNGVDVLDKHYNTDNTTPCVAELYRLLSIIKSHDCKVVVMEVSSEALLHRRIEGLKFEMVAFTNITEDHLNIHGTIDNYRKAKFSLVNYLSDNGRVYINGDDENCRMLSCKNMYTFGFNENNNFTFFDVKESDDFVQFSIKHDGEFYNVKSPLLGLYNVYNVGLAFILGLDFNIPFLDLINYIEKLEPVAGRSERLDFGQDFTIILDYAHTFNGILNIVRSVSKYKKIIVVTGAAGGREKEKRSKIGKMLLDLTDFVIFTMDDPRNESVDKIIDEMISNSTKANYARIVDRTSAIYCAFDMAKCGDIVLVLGKGRDNYMAIGDKKIPYSDYDVIAKYFTKLEP